jgi:hypothetical protein
VESSRSGQHFLPRVTVDQLDDAGGVLLVKVGQLLRPGPVPSLAFGGRGGVVSSHCPPSARIM